MLRFLPHFGTGVIASTKEALGLAQPKAPPEALIFNEPQYGGDRSYGLGWEAHPYSKIIVFGLPKSGNNWVKGLLSDYFEKPGINPFQDVEKSGIGITHKPLSTEIRSRQDFIHGVCLVRDLRDLIASYYHYSLTHRFRDARRTYQFDDPEAFYFDWFLSMAVDQYGFMTFVEDYARLSVPVLRYERLWDNPMAEMRKLLLRWGIEFDESRMSEAIEKNSLEALQTTGRIFEKHIDKSHFRKGGYGNYKSDLPPKIVADIEERFSGLQKRWGYA